GTLQQAVGGTAHEEGPEANRRKSKPAKAAASLPPGPRASQESATAPSFSNCIRGDVSRSLAPGGTALRIAVVLEVRGVAPQDQVAALTALDRVGAVAVLAPVQNGPARHVGDFELFVRQRRRALTPGAADPAE